MDKKKVIGPQLIKKKEKLPIRSIITKIFPIRFKVPVFAQ
jgi:hypothetical protein